MLGQSQQCLSATGLAVALYSIEQGWNVFQPVVCTVPAAAPSCRPRLSTAQRHTAVLLSLAVADAAGDGDDVELAAASSHATA